MFTLESFMPSFKEQEKVHIQKTLVCQEPSNLEWLSFKQITTFLGKEDTAYPWSPSVDALAFSLNREQRKFIFSLPFFCFDGNTASISTLSIINIAHLLNCFRIFLSHIKLWIINKNTINLSCLLLLSYLAVSFHRGPLFIYT